MVLVTLRLTGTVGGSSFTLSAVTDVLIWLSVQASRVQIACIWFLLCSRLCPRNTSAQNHSSLTFIPAARWTDETTPPGLLSRFGPSLFGCRFVSFSIVYGVRCSSFVGALPQNKIQRIAQYSDDNLDSRPSASTTPRRASFLPLLVQNSQTHPPFVLIHSV